MNGTSDVSKRYHLYILLSLKDKGLYIGFTTDLRSRLIHHARSEVTATRFRRPFKLIYYDYFVNRKDAIAREEFSKSGFGRKQFKKILKNTLDKL